MNTATKNRILHCNGENHWRGDCIAADFSHHLEERTAHYHLEIPPVPIEVERLIEDTLGVEQVKIPPAISLWKQLGQFIRTPRFVVATSLALLAMGLLLNSETELKSSSAPVVRSNDISIFVVGMDQSSFDNSVGVTDSAYTIYFRRPGLRDKEQEAVVVDFTKEKMSGYRGGEILSEQPFGEMSTEDFFSMLKKVVQEI